MSYAEAVRKRVAEKRARQKSQRRRTQYELKIQEFRKNTEIAKNCPFRERIFYKIKDLDESGSYPFKLDGVYMFLQIHYDWERYMWSDGNDHLHGMTFSTSFNVEWREATLAEVREFYTPDKDGSVDITGTGKVKQFNCS